MEQSSRKGAEPIEKFIHTLEQLSDIVKQLTEAEKAKADAASAREHEKIDSMLNQEQALILKLRGLDQQRARQAEELGWKGLTFREILDDADERDSSALSPLFQRLGQQLQELTDARDSADRMINVRLREFEHILGTGKSGGRVDIPSHFHDRYV